MPKFPLAIAVVLAAALSSGLATARTNGQTDGPPGPKAQEKAAKARWEVKSDTS